MPFAGRIVQTKAGMLVVPIAFCSTHLRRRMVAESA
jgi:hypothetical protein